MRPRFQDKGAMLLKCRSIPVKVGLRYTQILNSLSQIVSWTSRNGSFVSFWRCHMIFKRSIQFLYSIRINYDVINLSLIFVTSALRR